MEGFVPLGSLEGGHYIYRESARAIIGEPSKRAYRLGDRVGERMDRIDRSGNKLEFSVLNGSQGLRPS